MSPRLDLRSAVERGVSIAYGQLYDAVVGGFRPWEALLDEIAAYVARSVPLAEPRASIRVLDVACGTGTLARRLAREGYAVVGLDSVEHLVSVARARRPADVGSRLAFHHLDLARAPVPGAGNFEALVSLHTLYWHPDPERLLVGCRQALKPGGHAVFLTYTRPAHVVRTTQGVVAHNGVVEGFRALRWLLPTATFEGLRYGKRRYLTAAQLHTMLAGAGFQLLDSRETFLDRISVLAWVRAAMAPNVMGGGDR